MKPIQAAVARSGAGVLSTNKLIRNTYTLLSMTLLFSAATAGLSMVLNLPPMAYMLSLGGSLLLIWLVLPRTANSAAGIGVVFAITGLMGLGLGPILNIYAHMPNGPQIIATALGGTGAIFLGLSGYALTTKRDFSFMGGFLFTGLIVVLLAMLASMFFPMPGMSLAISAAVVLLMSGFILFDTSRMVNGGVDNYILMTVSLYLHIYNLFIHLLNLLGAMQRR